jgi:hypothetical protein
VSIKNQSKNSFFFFGILTVELFYLTPPLFKFKYWELKWVLFSRQIFEDNLFFCLLLHLDLVENNIKITSHSSVKKSYNST